MRRRFRPGFLVAALAILLIEILIALYVRDAFIRPYVGDVLAVMLVYCGLRAIFAIGPWTAVAISLAIAFAIEFGQMVNLVDRIGLGDNAIARVVIGTGFEVKDLVAYLAGGAIILTIDLLVRRRAN